MRTLDREEMDVVAGGNIVAIQNSNEQNGNQNASRGGTNNLEAQLNFVQIVASPYNVVGSTINEL